MVGQGTPVQIINVVFAKNQRNVQYDWASIPRKIREHSKCLANSVLRRIGNISAIYYGRPVSEMCALNADLGCRQACEHFSSCFKASPLFMRIDWLTDWIEFYTVSAISHPCDGGHDDKKIFFSWYQMSRSKGFVPTKKYSCEIWKLWHSLLKCY